jgi:hypothetical protein
MIATILLILAAICLFLAAVNFPSRVNLTALGLFFWVLTLLAHFAPVLAPLR